MTKQVEIVTCTEDWSLGFPDANATLAATITEITAQAGAPANIANQVCVVGASPGYQQVQIWSASGAAIHVEVHGWRWCKGNGLWSLAALLQFRATMHTVGPGANMFLGDTLYPALTHVINLNNANAITLDGSATWKVPGSLAFDTHGMKLVSYRLNPVSGTPKANLLVANYR